MGLLDIFDTDQGRLAMGLLSAAGPSRDPMSFGQRLFGAMQGFDQYRNQKADRATAEEERKRRAAMQDLQMRQITEAMAAQQAQRQAQAAALQKRNSYLDAIDPSKGPAMPVSVPAGLAAGVDIGELKALAPQQPAKPEYKTVGGSLVRIGPDGVTPVFTTPEKPDLGTTDMRNFKAVSENPAFGDFLREQANLKTPRPPVLNVYNSDSAKAETDLRKEFADLPQVKRFNSALPSYKAIEDAAKRMTPQSDINLVYGIAKLYDPESVVR